MSLLSRLRWRSRLRHLKKMAATLETVRTYTPQNYDVYLACVSHDPRDHASLRVVVPLSSRP